MIVISQNKETVILSQFITGLNVCEDNWDDKYNLEASLTSMDTPILATYSTKEQAQQEMMRLIEKLAQASTTPNTYSYQPSLDKEDI